MKTRLFAVLFGVLLLLASCGPKPAPADSAPAASGSEADEASDSAVVPVYFGEWKVTSSPGAAPGCAMSREEVEACVGLTMSYGEDRFAAEGITCEFLPGTAYAEGIITAEEFYAACRLEPSELGVSASLLLHVTVDIQGNVGQNRLLGRDFFVLGSDSLLIYCDGAFFLAERTSE